MIKINVIACVLFVYFTSTSFTYLHGDKNLIRFKEDEDPNPNQDFNISYTLSCIIKYSNEELVKNLNEKKLSFKK
ncbi:unnamed protein product [Rhizophagus irregularis]|uniref:Uncharacterized protein n=1 Tax=Rhizophagus irregularis TaxID=588596 RepID=A0A915ZD71_9GLOM|nr:hypothetical protein RIR_jg36333.t1 [Rhizophagus irregularis DAOM 181602=DAOM 197198]CAB5370255.1 unnamed protein product [Rhizophagus irregularis]CAB5370257.1 unnamed protein product [Rhizophagus irregularis]